MIKWVSHLFIFLGIILLLISCYSLYDQSQKQAITIKKAEQIINTARDKETSVTTLEEEKVNLGAEFKADDGDVIGILTIPKLNKSIGIVEGTDIDSLKNGVGHVKNTVYPNQHEQIVLSGHRDTVFQNFDQLHIGDIFIIEMSYGNYKYEIKCHEIVDWDDRSVIGKMGEEVLVVSTCYPFIFVGPSPERFIFYAYPK